MAPHVRFISPFVVDFQADSGEQESVQRMSRVQVVVSFWCFIGSKITGLVNLERIR